MFYKNKLRQLQEERRNLKNRIKKEFVDTGDADKLINKIHQKMEPTIKEEDLPF